VRGFWLGILIGGALGAAATWVGLRRPWQHAGPAAELADAGPAAAAPPVARRRGRRGPGRAPSSEAEIPVLGPADRRMVWQGDPVQLPARTLDLAAGEAGRPLNQSEIDRGVVELTPAITDCVARARGDAELAARLTVEFLVDAAGRTGASRVRAPSYLLQRGLLDCVRKALRALRFAATGAATVVTIPVELD
jgi:hypothetical protein